MVLPQLGQRKAIVDPAEKAGRLVWIRRDGHLRGSLWIFTDDDFHVAVEVVGRHDQIQWRGHALVDENRQIELRTVAGAVETTLLVRVGIRRRRKIGRASCRERRCQYGKISGGAGS